MSESAMGDRYLPHRSIAAVLFAIAVALWLVSSSARASGWPAERLERYQGARVTDSSAIVLTRMCVGETGPLDLYTCAAQVGVVARRAARRGMRVESMAELYSSALRRPRRRWILELTPGGDRPSSFPARASWARFSPSVERLHRMIVSQLAGEVRDPCPIATHFGSVRLDGHRARRGGWTRVCREVNGRQGLWITPADLERMQRTEP